MIGPERAAPIVVLGVGGAGGNAVRRLADHDLKGARLVAVDTSAQALEGTGAPHRLLLANGSRGLGTGGDVGLGRAAARTDAAAIADVVRGSDLALVVAGLAGGTGGGASPEVAAAARSAGAIVVGFGIMPFSFERGERQRVAQRSRRELREACDAFVAVETPRAEALAHAGLPLEVALRVADDVVRQAAQGLCSLVGGAGWLGVDLAAVREIVRGGGEGCVAVGLGRGDAPAVAAVRAALASPLTDMRSLAWVRRALVHFTGGADLAVADVAAGVAVLRGRLSPDATFVVGAAPDPWLVGAAQVAVLALRGRAGGEMGVADRRTMARPETLAPALVTREAV